MKNEYLKEITIKVIRVHSFGTDGFWRTQVDDGHVVIRDDTQDGAEEGDFNSFLIALECAKARAIQIAAK